MEKGRFIKAQQLRNRIKDLLMLQRDLESNAEILCGTVSEATFGHKITEEMKKTLLKMCIGEIATLEKEFDEL